MANHVTTNISITGLTEDTLQYFKSLCGHLKGTHIGNYLFDLEDDVSYHSEKLAVQYLYDEINEDTPYDSQWMYDNVGAKWCNLEDIEIYNDELTIQTVSAWSYPREFVEYLLTVIEEKQTEYKAFVTYDDEMPNFFGCEVYVDGACADGEEWVEDEIDDLLSEQSTDYATALYNYNEAYENDADDVDELYDALYDIKSDILYDTMHEAQNKVFCEYQ